MQGQRPLNVSESLYQVDSDALLLQKQEDCRHPDLNTISPEELASMFDFTNKKSAL